MRVFKDDKGDAWELAITVGAVRRVKAYLPGIDLLKIDGADPEAKPRAGLTEDELKAWKAPPLNLRLTCDPVLVAECICCVLKPTLDARGLSPDDFYDRMAGPGMRDGLAAFWEDLDDFFLSLGRSDLSALAKAARRLLAEIVSESKSEIEAWDLSLRNNGSQSSSTNGTSSGDSPASPASTPTP